MNSISPAIKDMDNEAERYELSPEDKIVSPYLVDRSETYRDLVKMKNDVSDSIAVWDLALPH